jgi:hypothetical protein
MPSRHYIHRKENIADLYTSHLGRTTRLRSVLISQSKSDGPVGAAVTACGVRRWLLLLLLQEQDGACRRDGAHRRTTAARLILL